MSQECSPNCHGIPANTLPLSISTSTSDVSRVFMTVKPLYETESMAVKIPGPSNTLGLISGIPLNNDFPDLLGSQSLLLLQLVGQERLVDADCTMRRMILLKAGM